MEINVSYNWFRVSLPCKLKAVKRCGVSAQGAVRVVKEFDIYVFRAMVVRMDCRCREASVARGTHPSVTDQFYDLAI